MKCIKWCSCLFSLLVLSICLTGCYVEITEAEPDPAEIIDMKYGETQSFRVDGYVIAVGIPVFMWETYPSEIKVFGKEFEFEANSENSWNRLSITCGLFNLRYKCVCWVPPFCQRGWGFDYSDTRTWDIRVTQDPTIWYGNYIIKNIADAEYLSDFVEVTGDLLIWGDSSLISLQPLSKLTSVGGDLTIFGNESLTSLTGLDNLSSIEGTLDIAVNYSLTDLNLDSLNFVGDDFTICRNNELYTFLAEDLRDQVLASDGIGGEIII